MQDSDDLAGQRARAEQLLQDGNFREALQQFRQLCLDPKNDSPRTAQDLANAVTCLQRLGEVAEADELLESTVRVHADNWRVLQQAASQYLNLPHHGYLLAGEFHRGSKRGAVEYFHSTERDRVRALQLMRQAMPLAVADDNHSATADFFDDLAQQLLYYRGYQESWRLQYLTNLDQLPDFEPGYPNWYSPSGAPVDEQGHPVYHSLPDSWEAAQTDGERWRWALAQVIEMEPRRRFSVWLTQADFYHHQFGVQTMQYGQLRPLMGWQPDDGERDESGTYALHTLSEQETIARLAIGIRRFPMPDEFNFIKIYQQIAAGEDAAAAVSALGNLAQLFENRRQYPRAAEYWQVLIDRPENNNTTTYRERLDQIVGNWGRFEPVSTQPAETGATVEFRFRNGRQALLTAHRIEVDQLLQDVQQYLAGRPRRLDGNKLQIENLGWRLVTQNETRYLGEKVAEWTEQLEPRPNHFDKRITVTTPLRDGGAYLLTAQMADGNTSKIVLWVADLAIVQKRAQQSHLYYVADAVTGVPAAGAKLDFFGFKAESVRREVNVETSRFQESANADGLVFPDPRDLKNQFSWLVVARNDAGQMAHLGFQGVWTGQYYDAQYNQVKVFNITDRPVYRPGQKVNYKFWVRRAQYDRQDSTEFAGTDCQIELFDPRGQQVGSWTRQTDQFGGLVDAIDLESDALLGNYRLTLKIVENGRTIAQGSNGFRVEEYKKPEYEVTVEAPEKPVMLGEKITAKITARYYFGAPVTQATVKYKVMRQAREQTWYPPHPWDWMYGRGFWWFAPDYTWYPGWSDWVGCFRPPPIWWPQRMDPPEVIAEQEVPIGADGTLEVPIDTEIAQQLQGDRDHEYTITAEVRDQSRRTIVGQGSVIAAREPYKVFCWVDRGYYRVGDTVNASFRAQTPDQRPVTGQGVVTLFKVTYDQAAKPVETPVRNWQLDTDEQGQADLKIAASAAGQYRLSYVVSDDAGHDQEGGYLFTIAGAGFDGRQFHFNALEIIPDQTTYQPDQLVQLQINTEQVNSHVLLFVRPSNSVYLPPQLLRLEGKSTIVELPVTMRDMPNFFVEAVTVAGAKVHSEVRELTVPPESRILNAEIATNKTEYLPGETADVQIHLTDETGENFVGSTVVAVYDKAVEYVSGGSNVPDIKQFFWQWRRHHQPDSTSNLTRSEYNLVLPGKTPMNDLGVFGGSVVDELASRPGMAEGLGETRLSAARGPQAAMARGALALGDVSAASADKAAAAGPEVVEPTVRSEFADTALWVGALETDATGRAQVSFKAPDNLTTWNVKLWALGPGTRVGQATTEVITRKNLLVRLQAPRFLVQGDHVVLSANVHNYLASPKRVTVQLEIDGDQLVAIDNPSVKIDIDSEGEQRVDWRVDVVKEGLVTLRMKALTDEESDAVQVALPVLTHGMLKTEAWAGTLRPEQDAAKMTVHVPSQRRAEQTELLVRFSPTLAGAMVDALPYLANYPYGCTEQTLNRFLPTVVTQKMLLDMDLNLSQIRDKRSNWNVQEIGDPATRAAQWQRYDRNPVFDSDEVQRMVKEGIEDLASMQNADGGWGWFSGPMEHSYPHTTAIVVHGLEVARQNDVQFDAALLQKGLEWLQGYQQKQLELIRRAELEDKKRLPWKPYADNLDALVYMVLVDADLANQEMQDFLYRDRNQLAVYAKAMFALALHRQANQARRDMLVRNIRQFLVEDEENETAYLKLPPDTAWWYWYGSEVEANAYFLKLLAQIEPEGTTAPRLVKYLLNNRKHATYWNSTRDTAICVEAFSDYLKATGEMRPQMTVGVYLDGQLLREETIDQDNLFSFDNTVRLSGSAVSNGSHEVEIRRTGKGSVYFNTYLTNFTLEDPISSAGLELRIDRRYYKLVPVDKTVPVPGSRGQVLDQRVEKYQRVELNSGDPLVSGDLVEVELLVDSKNDYEYLMFEDPKAAGFEPVEVRSGYVRRGLPAYMQLRDQQVTFFVAQLARGQHSVTYRLRAEVPGRFSALPATATGMYAPELRGNSDEHKVGIRDQ